MQGALRSDTSAEAAAILGAVAGVGGANFSPVTSSPIFKVATVL